MAIVNFFKNIGLDPTFKKTIDFPTKAKQQAWFSSKQFVSYDNVNYNKLQNTIKINTDIDFGEALSYTYCVISDLEDSSDRLYYCFVDGVKLITKGTVEFQLVLDPFQTFMCEFTIGESMVNREHCDRWSPTSTKPIRITPNTEAINCNNIVNLFQDLTQPITNNNTSKNYIEPTEMATCVVCYTKRNSSSGITETVKGVFPIGITYNSTGVRQSLNSYILGGTILKAVDNEVTTIPIAYPTINDLLNGKIPTIFGIPPEDIVYIAVIPIISIGLECYEMDVDSKNHYKYVNRVIGFLASETHSTRIDGINYSIGMQLVTDSYLDTVEDISINFKTYNKPTDGSSNLPSYEPALQIMPFAKFVITDGTGQVKMEVPEQLVLQGNTILSVRTLIGNSGVYNMLSFYTDVAAAGTEGAATVIDANYMDVINDNWLTYTLTQRDTDRKLVSNSNIQSAIDNLIFMGYGGSLVASRGASGNDSTQRRQKNIMTGVTQAVGMAVGASLITSAVDSHYAWEAQKLNETKIQNQPNNLLIVGTGSAMINVDTIQYRVFRVICDSENTKNYYQQFRKYGYEVNRFEVPNIKSRKYFNYIMTTECIIEGSINGSIKQDLATIFDSGITIFHGDYCTELTYPTEENIERSLL